MVAKPCKVLEIPQADTRLPVSVKYEDRRAYYDAFTAYHKDGDISPMLGIFAERERQRLLDCLAAIG